MKSLNEYEQIFTKKLIDQVITRLKGSHPDYAEFQGYMRPRSEFILGSLCPTSSVIDIKLAKSSIKAFSNEIMFLMKKTPSKIKVKPSFKVFYGQSIKNEEEDKKKIPRKTKFKRYDAPEMEFVLTEETDSLSHSYSDLRNTIITNFPALETEVPNYAISLSMKIIEYEKGLKLIKITFQNKGDEDANKIRDTTIFDVALSISIEEDLVPFDFSYEYEGYPENYSMDVLCTNCGANFDPTTNTILTFPEKIFSQDKVIPKTHLVLENGSEIQLKFKDLMDVEKRNKIFEIINKELQRYANIYEKNRPSSTNIASKKYLILEKKFIELKDRFQKGTEFIMTDEKVSRAFSYLQESFYETNKGKYEGWRLFQLMFLVSQIPNIVKFEDFETAEVLHVATGGGKSEAYFALVVFVAFHDRLRGKTEGITAITKFPLRMLSIQQLQRVAYLMIVAEKIRRKYEIKGAPFSVSYFVGNKADEFPGYNKDLIEKIKNGKEDLLGKIIDVCPDCSKKVVLAVRDSDETVIHKCKGCCHEFELYFTDEETYRKLPTFIVATVDKFSGISQQRKMRNLFGGKLNLCEKHGYIAKGDKCEAVGKTCQEQGTSIEKFSQGPTLVIQDEMHLVRESFGTIDAHFEAFMEILQKKFQGNGFKNIAMTATISGAHHQIKELYNKKVRVFPGECPLGMGINDFFFVNKINEQQRFLIGLRPNVRENQFAIRTTFDHILTFIKDVETDIQKFSDKSGIPIDIVKKLLSNYKSYLSYHHKKNDVQDIKTYVSYKYQELENIGEYCIEPIALTGDNTLEEIRDIIRGIEREDTLNAKKLKTVFATSVVSHGVDISKWNIMCFQGMARSTAEYIQALSRVGRQHVGIVFLWFYPNRVRDISYYDRFIEYHQILDHHVTEVPIKRFAQLGFFQTFNSLFCAGIINYFSDIAEKPLYKVEDVVNFFENTNNREELIKFLKEAYLVSTNREGADFYENEIANETEKRLNKLDESFRNKTLSRSELNFFPTALTTSPNPYFKNQSGMRGIQSNLVLYPASYHESQIKGYIRKLRGE